MGENKQKGYKQTNLAVLADREVCVTVGMGCGKKAVPESSGVPEGLCYSWSSRSQGCYASCLEHVWLEGWEAFGIEPAAWWLLVQECILSILSCNHPTLLCCMLLGAGAARMHRDFLLKNTFFPHWLCLGSPTVF